MSTTKNDAAGDTQPTAPQISEHKLLKPHTHAGRDLAPGDPIMLRPDQVERLRAEKKIK